MGCTAEVVITASARWSVHGRLLRVLCTPRAPPPPQGAPPAADPPGGSSTGTSTSSADAAEDVRSVVACSSSTSAVSPTAAAAAPAGRGGAGGGAPDTLSSCSAAACSTAACSETRLSKQVRDARQPQQPDSIGNAPAPLDVRQPQQPASVCGATASQPAETHASKPAPFVTRAAPDAAAESAAQPSPSMAEWSLPDQLLALGVILGLVGLLLSGLLTLASSLQAG